MIASKRTYLLEIIAIASVFIVNELFFSTIKYSSQMAEVISLILITYFFSKRGSSWKDAGFQKPKSWWKAVVYFILCVATIGLTFNFIIQPLFPTGANGISHEEPLSLAQMIIELLLVGIGTAAIGEEMLFRGFLLNNINKLLGKNLMSTLLAILIQAICFAVLHSGLQGMVSAGVIGIILGIFYVLSGRNLWVVMAAHAVPDVLSFISSYQNQ
ncbi:type II CAAX endopeptidase family protein [Algoriphagus sp. SE2]|uniref:CPBP family intramembrane glutamic endopeptidase n=1 Tax=Algoriphagus sp. SE2 TaxID=3141536 RepID=UPI0031CD0911